MIGRPGVPESLLHLATTDSALACAQREAWRVIRDWRLQHIADVVELLTLELVSVALGRRVIGRRLRFRDMWKVRLVGVRFQLTAEDLVISTWDGDPRPPPFKRPGTGHHDDTELYFVPMLAQAWDYFPADGGGKVVWCEVRIPPVGERWLPHRTPIIVPAHHDPRTTDDPELLARVLRGLRHL